MSKLEAAALCDLLTNRKERIKKEIAGHHVRKARISKVLCKWRVYQLNRGNSKFMSNQIERLEKDYTFHTECLRTLYIDLHRTSAAFCKAREVKRGNSTKPIVEILLTASGA